MQKKVIDFNKKARDEKKMPEVAAGDIIEAHLKIKEGEKERIQVFKGLVIAVKGGQSSSRTITIRKVSHGVGVEMILPVLSKNVEKIKIIKRAKVRRSKLYYVRELSAKQSRMKYKDISEFAKIEEAPVEAEKVEEVKEEKVEEK